MRFHVVLNREGGTFRTLDMEAYRARLATIFSDHGHELTFDVVTSGDLAEALERAAGREDADAMIAGGGDGTVSAAARVAWKSGMPLGVIPAGTMNLFARSLGLPLDIEQVLPALADATAASVDISSVNGQGFIHQVSVGLHPRMVRFRNGFAFRSRLGKIRASTRAALGVILDPPAFAAAVDVDGEKRDHMVSMISVSNNPFGPDPLMFQDRLDTGRLGLYLAPPLPPAGVARLALDILSGRRDSNPDLDAFKASRVALRFPKHRRDANMVVDGELVSLPPELVVCMHAGALSVLKPAREVAAAAAR